jgi:hypothetical protein
MRALSTYDSIFKLASDTRIDHRPQIARYSFSETTIADNDPAIADVSVSTTDSQAGEHPNNSETGTLSFTRSGGELGQALTVNIQPVTGVNPARPEDYFLTSSPANSSIQATSTGWSLTFPANVSVVSVKLQPVDDSLVEETEYARFKLATGIGYNIVTPENQEITIYDNEPTVTVITADATATENSLDNAAFRFDRTSTNASSGPLTVIFSVSGKAVLNTDYRFESTYGLINFVGTNQFSITINAQDGLPVERMALRHSNQ